jgi:hypothetical protein
MKGYVTALCLSTLLGVAGAASAATAVFDFSGTDPASNLAVVDVEGGKTTSVTQKDRKGVQTGGDGTNQYLYLDVKDDLFKGAKALYMNVEYFNTGTDQFRVEYGAIETDADGNQADNAFAVANPPTKTKANANTWTTQVFTLANPNLLGGMEGKADIRIDDMADGPEIIGRITISDEDPRRPNIAQVDPAKPITIDGVKKEGEWEGAYTFTLNAAEFDAVNGTNWTSPEDFTGTYSFKWDETGLYVLGEVIDDDPLHADRDSLWENDGVELYIGLDQSNPGRTAYLAESDFQVITALKSEPVRVVYRGSSGAEGKGPEPVAPGALVVVKTDKGYMFEYLLRWDYIKEGFKPTPGQAIGFNMFGNDSDTDPGGQDTAMTPFKGQQMYTNPSAWVTATLAPHQVVTNPPPTAGN